MVLTVSYEEDSGRAGVFVGHFEVDDVLSSFGTNSGKYLNCRDDEMDHMDLMDLHRTSQIR